MIDQERIAYFPVRIIDHRIRILCHQERGVEIRLRPDHLCPGEPGYGMHNEHSAQHDPSQNFTDPL